MLVTFSGLDGSGKSTIAESLRTALERDNRRAVVFHMNEHVGLYAYLRTIRDAVKKPLRRAVLKPVATSAPSTAGQPSRKGGRVRRAVLEVRRRIIWNKAMRRWIDLGDLLVFLTYRFCVEKLGRRVLIMDRYFYDRLADIADGRRWQYIQWFVARLAPVPDLAVFVDVSPEEAFARKGEYSVESMTRRRASYQQIFAWVPGHVVLKNDDLDRAVGQVTRLVLDRSAGSEAQ